MAGGTLVFMDFEATGLPLSKPRITEVAFVAVARQRLIFTLPSSLSHFISERRDKERGERRCHV